MIIHLLLTLQCLCFLVSHGDDNCLSAGTYSCDQTACCDGLFCNYDTNQCTTCAKQDESCSIGECCDGLYCQTFDLVCKPQAGYREDCDNFGYEPPDHPCLDSLLCTQGNNDNYFCTINHWTECITVTHKYIMTSISIIPILVIIFIIYNMKKFMNIRKEGEVSLYKGTILYFIVTIILLLICSCVTLNKCFGNNLGDTILATSQLMLYQIHFTLYLLLLFFRLYHVFKASVYSLSKWTKYLYIFAIFLVYILTGFIYYFFLVHYWTGIWFMLGLVLYAVFILDMVWIEILYVYKLFRVVKNTTNKGDKESVLLVSISRYTILSTLSVIVSLIWLIINAMQYDIFQPFPRIFAMAVGYIIDIVSNIMCFTLGYAYSNGIYGKLCGCVDKQCRRCCSVLISLSMDKSDNEVILQTIHSTSKGRTNTRENINGQQVDDRSPTVDNEESEEMP